MVIQEIAEGDGGDDGDSSAEEDEEEDQVDDDDEVMLLQIVKCFKYLVCGAQPQQARKWGQAGDMPHVGVIREGSKSMALRIYW